MAFWDTSGGTALTAAPDAAGEAATETDGTGEAEGDDVGARETDGDADGEVEAGMLILGVIDAVKVGEEVKLAVGLEVEVWAGVAVQADKIMNMARIAIERINLPIVLALNCILTSNFCR